MVSATIIEEQLKNIGFNYRGWGRTEVQELQNIILPDEEIYEAVNGFYEGGFALLVATDVRVLLIDKKPLNYLTVEDLRFDMINELDYNHRLLGAYISISAGNKNLKFTSVNQPRLRKLIGHVQRCMAELKKNESTHRKGQVEHLEQINQQLQSYLVAQYRQQQKLSEQLQEVRHTQGRALPETPVALRPDPQLADYLYAQSLLAAHQVRTGKAVQVTVSPPLAGPSGPLSPEEQNALYAEGRDEIFGKRSEQLAETGGTLAAPPPPEPQITEQPTAQNPPALHDAHHGLEINPLRLVYAVMPLIRLSRKLGRPSLHHQGSQEAVSLPAEA